MFKTILVSLIILQVTFIQAAVEFKPCEVDHEYFCKKKDQSAPESAEAWSCLRKNSKKIEKACLEQVQHQEFHTVCKAETVRLCANVEAGEGRIHECMSKASKAQNIKDKNCLDFIKKNKNYLKENSTQERHMLC